MSDISVSQNFLKSKVLVQNLITKTNICSEDTVLEIGAGKGIITEALSHICKQVISIELDEELFENLQIVFAGNHQITLINEDFLNYKLPQYNYKVFSNIPFNLTSAIVNKLLLSNNSAESVYLIMQKEAAHRYLGNSEGYLLHALLFPFFEMGTLYDFNKQDFDPVPNADTVLFNAIKRNKPLVDVSDKSDYYDFVSFIINQQKPSLKLRMEKVFTYEQIKRLFSELNLNKESTIKELDVQKLIRMFDVYKKYVPDNKQYLTHKAYENYLSEANSQLKQHRTKKLFHKN